MKFYRTKDFWEAFCPEFQFPTGWNSTHWKEWLQVGGLGVSIPNGMEFYAWTHSMGDSCKMFQFPTGWNSTVLIGNLTRDIERFNSQRDGILHFLGWRQKCRICPFQFPTGWNSTESCEYSIYPSVVSIPNGMKFYGIFISLACHLCCFNSQQDGIILKQATINAGFAICFNSQ